jgi:hypothetical protein
MDVGRVAVAALVQVSSHGWRAPPANYITARECPMPIKHLLHNHCAVNRPETGTVLVVSRSIGVSSQGIVTATATTSVGVAQRGARGSWVSQYSRQPTSR